MKNCCAESVTKKDNRRAIELIETEFRAKEGTQLTSRLLPTQRARNIADLMIYSSIALGLVLLAQLYSLGIPSWLFFTVLSGWIGYLITGIAIAKRVLLFYPVAIVLALATLAVSLPQPEHYSFGFSLPTITFLAGSILQVGVVASVARYLVFQRKTLVAQA